MLSDILSIQSTIHVHVHLLDSKNLQKFIYLSHYVMKLREASVSALYHVLDILSSYANKSTWNYLKVHVWNNWILPISSHIYLKLSAVFEYNV